MKYGNRSMWKKIISSPFTLVVVIILFLFLTKAVWTIREKKLLSVSRLKATEDEFAKLEAHQKDLSDQINFLSTEQGMESELRTKYRAIRDGESVAVIIDNKQTVSVSKVEVNIENKNSWWSRILQVFGF